MRFNDIHTMTKLAQMILEYDEPILPLKQVAEGLGKPYSTLIRELNPDDEYAKFGADLILPIMKITGDIRPLQWLAEKMGYSLVKNNEVQPDKANWQEESIQDSICHGEIARLMMANAPFEKVSAEIDKMITELQETRLRYREHCHAQNRL